MDNRKYINLDWVTQKRFSELTGITLAAIKGKIQRGVWLEGDQYKMDPDGNIQISLRGWDKWVRNSQRVCDRATKEETFKSTSPYMEKTRPVMKPSTGHPPKVISPRRVSSDSE